MCQLVTGEQVVLKRRRAWKVFGGTPIKPRGVYYTPAGSNMDMLVGSGAPYKLSKVYSAIPTQHLARTSGGFHVFATQEGAEDYCVDLERWGIGSKCILQVQVWGQALPFESDNGHKGWAVENMLIPARR